MVLDILTMVFSQITQGSGITALLIERVLINA